MARISTGKKRARAYGYLSTIAPESATRGDAFYEERRTACENFVANLKPGDPLPPAKPNKKSQVSDYIPGGLSFVGKYGRNYLFKNKLGQKISMNLGQLLLWMGSVEE